MTEIYKHRVYRELQAASRITSENIVRYFNSWIEELDKSEKQQEIKYRNDYLKALNLNQKQKNKQKSIMDSSSDGSLNLSLRKSIKGRFSFGKSDIRDDSRFITKSIIAQGKKQIIREEVDEDDSVSESEEDNGSRLLAVKKPMNLAGKSRQTISSSGDNQAEVTKRTKSL